VVVSGRTEVLDPSVVTSVPPPGESGKLIYAGGNDLTPGEIVAIGSGPHTPDGFLGRVTEVGRVAAVGDETEVETVPADLLVAVKDGELDATANDFEGSEARVGSRARPAAAVSCTGSASATITPSVSFGVNFKVHGDWTLFGGLQSASVTANANANASLAALVRVAGSCQLGQTPVLQFPGPILKFFVGPVPVVITSKVTVYLDAGVSASASVTASASAGFSATGGLGWQKGRGFYPIQKFESKLNYTPPTVSAGGSVGAYLTPTLNVLLYGVAGPQIAFKAGLAFNADISQNPWWTLTLPVNLTAAISMPVLRLTSPSLNIYQNTFPLANAGGPFPAPTSSTT
jgi:hypothetical protein